MPLQSRSPRSFRGGAASLPSSLAISSLPPLGLYRSALPASCSPVAASRSLFTPSFRNIFCRNTSSSSPEVPRPSSQRPLSASSSLSRPPAAYLPKAQTPASAQSMNFAKQFSTEAAQPSPAAPSQLPLSGIRVLDMTRVLAGPYCTQILGDMGAEIIKIEHPVRGDDTRAWGPPYAPYQKPEESGAGESAYFLCANRNKKSVALSYADPDGVAVLHELVRKSDVLVENYLPGTLAKYGLDYATIAAINPRIIYASVTGYGQTGPYSHRAGYDVMVEAEFGLMHITGARDGPAVKVGVAVTDLTTGLYTSNAIMAALLGRTISGKGTHIDASLSDCQTATLANIASSVLISGKADSGRWGTAHPSIVPYESFQTKDGSVLLGAGNDRLFGILSRGLGRGEWHTDEQYSTNASRVKNRKQLVDQINDITRTQPTKHWMDIFSNSGLPCAPINDVKTALELEHTKARGMVKTLNHPRCGDIKVINTPIKFTHMVDPSDSKLPSPPESPTPSMSGKAGADAGAAKIVERPVEPAPGPRTAPPLLGQHTLEVLSGLVGMSDGEISRLVSKGVVSTGKERK